MKITRISKTKRGRFALFVDDEFLFSVDDETLVKFNIHEGTLIEPENLDFIKDASDLQKAKNQALRYLSLRAYGEQELFNKLCMKHDEETSAKILSIMCELQLLNDKEFAFEKAKGMAFRKKTSKEIYRTLVGLGIDNVLAQGAVDAAAVDDVQLATKLIESKYMQKLAAGEKEKVMAALARRGFAYPEIKEGIAQALENAEQENIF